ncbi:LOW QUALITY PROTEIN: interferon regulatory factor 3 [Eudromia elegans]
MGTPTPSQDPRLHPNPPPWRPPPAPGAPKPLILPWLRAQLDGGSYPGVRWLGGARFRVPWKHGLRHDVAPQDFQLFQPLILPWLRAQLDGGSYPGVRWLGGARFRVPWKHGLRHDVAPQDFQLFQDWAIASGTYRPGVDPPAPAVWKRNFRSALNRKEGLRLARDHSGDARDPHKVYEFVGGAGGAGAAPPPGSPGHGPEPPPQAAGGAPELPELDLDLDCREQDWDVDEVLDMLVLSSLEEDGSSLLALPPGAAPQGTDLEVHVFYRGHQVLQTTAEYTGRLLRGLGGGAGLRARGGLLEGTRRGSCRVFWGRGGRAGPGPPGGALAKGTYGPLYGLRDFVRELIAFLEERGGAPPVELWLCLGEPWPEPGTSWTRRLIMVQVVPVALRLLLELGRAQGASSLRSSDLQLSASLGEGGLLGALRSWDERMDTRPPP